MPSKKKVPVVRSRGRPALADSERKVRVTLRLDPKVLDYYRSTGRGWQTRISEVLRRAVKRSAAK